ncbi:MAG: zinc ribbon domain-containing protein [Candidatus Marinimicrobia bacterium]|jgi:putative FmdB family regulatory protein|nr:zinc ribbon domain-containing protein [Candidatus Woesearchaeota archaeon]MBT5995821.1 zinc ribbon domain-containing protein [Candidatus Neomarinimicrobiota bacterium]MBT6936690.1 zinc ribbon domain-containing protein [Candidatus Neomarinimicrobiota bacterium]
MPIYEYVCEDCGHDFEEILHFSERDDPIEAPCPNPTRPLCEGKVHLKVSLGSFHLKGGGWYKDGYGTNKQKPKTKSLSKTSDGVTKARSIVND